MRNSNFAILARGSGAWSACARSALRNGCAFPSRRRCTRIVRFATKKFRKNDGACTPSSAQVDSRRSQRFSRADGWNRIEGSINSGRRLLFSLPFRLVVSSRHEPPLSPPLKRTGRSAGRGWRRGFGPSPYPPETHYAEGLGGYNSSGNLSMKSLSKQSRVLFALCALVADVRGL